MSRRVRSHTRRRGRIYRYYVIREAIADGYDSCAVTSVSAADVEGAVLDHIQKLLGAPELIARTWRPQSGRTRTTSPSVVTVLLAVAHRIIALLFLTIMMLASWEKKDGLP